MIYGPWLFHNSVSPIDTDWEAQAQGWTKKPRFN